MPQYKNNQKVPDWTQEGLYFFVSEEIDRFVHQIPKSFGAFEIKHRPNDFCVEFSSKWIQANLKCLPAELVLEADLSWAALPFKGKLDQAIEGWVSRLLAMKSR